MNASSVAGGTVSTVSAPDQRVDVIGVRVARVLGAGRRPQQALRSRARRGQLGPARRRDGPLVDLVRHLGVGDRQLAQQRLAARRQRRAPPRPCPSAACRRRCRRATRRSWPPTRGRRAMPPAATRSSSPARYASTTSSYCSSEKISVTLTLTPLRGEGADRRDALGRRRHLDHDVGTPDLGRQPQPLRHRLVGRGRQLRQHLQRDRARRRRCSPGTAAASDRRRRGCPRSPAARRSPSSSGPRRPACAAPPRSHPTRRSPSRRWSGSTSCRARPARSASASPPDVQQAAAHVVVPDALAEGVGTW